MKRLLNILVLLTLVLGGLPVQLQAQDQTQEQGQFQPQEQILDQPTTVTNVSYIYRNDDHFDGFADSEIDSITFSRIDAEGIEHDDYVTQVVYTPDSIYYIPLAAIDSVLCQQPEIELQDDVVMLSADQLGFVVRSDSTTILFRSDTPRNLLPERGEVLLAMTTAEQNPMQFTGRVLHTQRTADGVLVTCDPDVQIGDIFRRFTTVMFTSPPPVTGSGNEEWDVPHSGNRETFDPFSKSFKWEPKTREYTDPDTKEKIKYTENYVSGIHKTVGPFNKNLLDLLPENKPKWLDHAEVNVGLNFEVNYRQKFLIDFFKDKDDWIIPSLYFYWRPTFLPICKGSIGVKISGEYSKDIESKVGKWVIPIWTPPVPPVPPIRVGEVNINAGNFYIRMGGEAELTYKFTVKKILDIEIEHNSSGTHVTDMAASGKYTDQSGFTSDGFEFGESDLGDDIERVGSGYIWVAWNPSVGVSLITEKVLTAAFDLKVGPWLQLNIDKVKEVPEDKYTRFYQTWLPTHLLSKAHVEGDFTLTIGKGTSIEKKLSVVETLKNWDLIKGDGFDFGKYRFGIFPTFGTPKLAANWEQSLNYRGALPLITSYGNPKDLGIDHTLLKTKLGLGLYKVDAEGNQTEVAKAFSSTEKGWFSGKSGEYTTEFHDVKRFKVAPLFDPPFFDPIRATTETDVTIPPSAITDDVTSVGKHHCFMNGHTIGLKSFNDYFGGQSTLGWILKKGEVGGVSSEDLHVNNALKSGSFHDNEVKNSTENGEDKLTFGPDRCDGLTPATTYIYRAWAQYTNGFQTKVTYGEVKEFTTDPPEDEPRCEIDLGLSVIWACYNVGAAKEQQNGNYYAWGEKETKKEYTAANYKLPKKDNISGDTNYDVATTWNVGKNSGWRMPTKAEVQELIDNCDMEWTTYKKVQGLRVTSRINGNTMFLPAAGNKYGKKVYSNGIGGCYWTGDSAEEEEVDPERNEEEEEGIGEGDYEELTAEEKANAWRFHFNNSEDEGKVPHNEAGRCFYGRSVRPVKDNPNYKPKEPEEPEVP